jgi:hypothetical protein
MVAEFRIDVIALPVTGSILWLEAGSGLSSMHCS